MCMYIYKMLYRYISKNWYRVSSTYYLLSDYLGAIVIQYTIKSLKIYSSCYVFYRFSAPRDSNFGTQL